MFEGKVPTEEVRKEIVRKIRKEYEFVEVGSIGKSVCGRDIEVLSIGNRKRKGLWVGSHHGMEWLTTLLVFEFFYDICKNLKFNKNINGINVNEVINQRGLTIVPCVNPDGVEISLRGFGCVNKGELPIRDIDEKFSEIWQSNANGVDLNHNYDAGWELLHDMERANGIVSASNTRYGGKYPESEPETKALTDFCRANEFEYAMAFHSQGEEIYWEYGENTPKNSKNFANLFALISGYRVSKPEGLAVGGGFKDWFIEEFGKSAYTVEVGRGRNPLPLESFTKIYKKLKKAMYFCVMS